MGPLLTPAGIAALRPYVVNLSCGEFSCDGMMQTSPLDVDEIFDFRLPAFIEARRPGSGPVPLVIWAHGGIVSERAGLTIAANQVPWWLHNGAYPIHFVWETGFLETMKRILRDVDLPGGDDASAELESNSLAGPFGSQLWTAVKQSAAAASRRSGGARYVGERLARFCAQNPGRVSVHAVGHSAGAIFHSHFIPAARQEGAPPFESLQLLAPALRVDGFRSQLLPLVGKDIGQLTLYTMNMRAENDDHCFQVYRRSLLYLVSRVFEPESDAPILGLEQSIRDDAELAAAFGLTGGELGRAEVIFSPTGNGAPPDRRSNATSHGGFDNDVDTMNSVARRILRTPDIVGFPAGSRSSAREWNSPVGSSRDGCPTGLSGPEG
jgi:hypothetical protein